MGGPYCTRRVSSSREQITIDEETCDGGSSCFLQNKILQDLKKTVTRGLMFRMGVISWHLGDFVIGSIERPGEPYRSQGGRMTILAKRSLVDQAECGFHLIACTSNTLKRVCRSTLTAETYQMELGVEAADQLRATIVDMFVPLSRKQWEIEAKPVQSSWYG